jgi:hypothetical protein
VINKTDLEQIRNEIEALSDDTPPFEAWDINGDDLMQFFHEAVLALAGAALAHGFTTSETLETGIGFGFVAGYKVRLKQDTHPFR